MRVLTSKHMATNRKPLDPNDSTPVEYRKNGPRNISDLVLLKQDELTRLQAAREVRLAQLTTASAETRSNAQMSLDSLDKEITTIENFIYTAVTNMEAQHRKLSRLKREKPEQKQVEPATYSATHEAKIEEDLANRPASEKTINR